MGLDDPFPDFAWSHSRHGTLRECARRFYYSHYASWRGWSEEAPEEARRSYRLGKLKALDIEVGTAIHQRAYELTEIARAGREPPPAATLSRRTRERLRPVWEATREEFLRDPRGRPMLRTRYYGAEPEEAVLDRVRRKIERCHPNLRDRDLWERIRARKVHVLYAEDREAGFTPPNVRVAGEDVFARPDLVLRDERDGITIVDWKTGTPRDEDVRQLAVYGLFARQNLGAAECRGRAIYLFDGSSITEELTADRLDDTRERIAGGIAELRAYAADPETNEPREKEAFALAENRWACRRCNYFELCEEELRASGELPWE